MNGLLYFFDDHVKPHILKGTHLLKPEETGKLPGGISAIREGDVNLWLVSKDGRTIAIDTGHINYPRIATKFRRIDIDPHSVNHVLLTHADVDHAGGIDEKAKYNIYPNAAVYLGRKEEQYLKREIHRMVKLGRKIYNCVSIKDGYHLLDDMDELELDGFHVRAIEVPGHTMGHMCYMIDDEILFSGDSMAINRNGGYPFWDFFCQDPEMNRKSLHHLKEVVEKSGIRYVCTGHSGFWEADTNLFAHIDEAAPFGRKMVFDENAEDDVCRRT